MQEDILDAINMLTGFRFFNSSKGEGGKSIKSIQVGRARESPVCLYCIYKDRVVPDSIHLSLGLLDLGLSGLQFLLSVLALLSLLARRLNLGNQSLL